jgi:hypothetical protein
MNYLITLSELLLCVVWGIILMKKNVKSSDLLDIKLIHCGIKLNFEIPRVYIQKKKKKIHFM